MNQIRALALPEGPATAQRKCASHMNNPKLKLAGGVFANDTTVPGNRSENVRLPGEPVVEMYPKNRAVSTNPAVIKFAGTTKLPWPVPKRDTAAVPVFSELDVA